MMPCACIEMHPDDRQYALLPLRDGKSRSILRSKYYVCAFLSLEVSCCILPVKMCNPVCVWEIECVCVLMCVCVCVCVGRCWRTEHILPEGCELSLCPIYKGVTNKLLFSRQSSFTVFALFLWRLQSCLYIEVQRKQRDILCHIRLSECEQLGSELELLREHYLLIHVYLVQTFLPLRCTRHLLAASHRRHKHSSEW